MKEFSDLRALSYRQGREIVHVSQDEHGRILVVDDGDYRILNFDSIFEQSSMRLSYPYRLVHEYTQLMLLVLAFIEPRQVSLFGLGGGSLLRTLHHMLPECRFDVVELRRTVIDIAKNFFLLPDDHRVIVGANDALTEISRIESGSSDVVFSDMFDAYAMVPAQVQTTFLSECSRILSKQGWLVVNLHGVARDSPEFLNVVGREFPTVILSATAENTILFASNTQPGRITPNLHRIKAMEKLLQQNFSRLVSRLRPLNFQFKS